MGIDIRSSLLVGADYSELEDFIQGKVAEGEDEDYYPDEYEIVEEYFEVASPYYDAPLEECFLGFRIPNFTEVNREWFKVAKEASDHFKALTGVKARIRGGAHVY